MKRKCLNRILSILLVAAMVLSLGPTVLAAQEQRVPFRQVEADAPLEREPADIPQDTSYAPTDLVRVSIVLEDRPGLEQMEASSGLSTAALAVSPQMQQTRQSLEANQAALARRISNQVLGGEPLDVVWNLTLAANLISANVPYGKVEEIQAMPGVKTVVLETRYEPAVYSQGPADPNMSTSAEMIGSSAAYAAGLTGAGTRIAVIDTGTDTDHQSFDAAAFAYALAEDAKNSGRTYDLLDEAEIREKLAQLNISRNGGPSAQELYVNEKLPFGYNYVDHDLDITHDHDDQGEHGSHVAGIATANRYIPSEDGYTDALTAVHVQGVAPDAQLLTMKVFGKNGGAYDSDYMAAIEDAILLGCDAVNLSLGSTSPGYATNAVYQDLLDRLSETDVVVSVAAGNAGSWADGVWNGHLYSDAVSLDMVGSPGSYTNALTVASADNVGYTGRYLTVQERAIFYTETISRNKPLETLAGQPLEYVLVEGVGDDWTGIDLTGKVAVCARGTINFSEKANKAAEAGAVAVLIYNNVPGALSMDLSEYWYEPPCVSLTQSDGQWMRDQGELHTETIEEDNWGEIVTREIQYYTGELTVAQNVSTVIYDEPYTMSDFSSWGVPGSLELKPEITAPGGNIYSVNGVIPGGESYETMSGTSMAAPQIAGMAALVSQYLKETGLAGQEDLSLRQLSQSLLMSTAQPLKDGENYYPVIQQGAGLANVGSAISASSYVLVDGQPDGKVKAELGDDPDRTGAYQVSFTLNNLTKESQNYLLSAELFTQAVEEGYKTPDDEYWAELGEAYETAQLLSQHTAGLQANVAWSINGKAVELDNRLIHMDFNGDGSIDADDAQALLDYVAGIRTDISNPDYADLDGDQAITSYDAYLFLERLNRGEVTLPAGGEVRITVTMTLTEAQKKALDESYENGAYIQGYVFAVPEATAEGLKQVSHSIPVLAFYGNWTDASMFEAGSWLEYSARLDTRWPYMGWTTCNYITGTSAGSGSQYNWGGNPETFMWDREDYLPERASLNNQNGDALCQYFVSPIRNAANAKMQIRNVETGEIYKQRELGSMGAGFYYSAASAWQRVSQPVNLTWSGTDAQGQPLPEGTVAEVQVTLAPEYYVDAKSGRTDWEALGDGATLTTQVTIDNTTPELTGVRVDPVSRQLTVTAKDNQFVAILSLYNPDNGASYGIFTPNQQTPSETVSQVFDLSNFTGTKLRAVVYDYAANSAVYDVSVGEIFGNQEVVTEFGAFWSGEWLLFNRDSSADYETYNLGEQASAVGDVQAAADVDGKVFMVTPDGALYVQNEDLKTGLQYICTLEVTPTDLAYNAKDGFLYGISESDGLVRIDKLTGACTKVGMPGIRTGTLACDEAGTFYSLSCEDNGLYRFTLDTLSQPELIDVMEYRVNADQQTLEWSCNDGSLYWIQYDNPNGGWWIKSTLIQVDPATAACTTLFELFNDPVIALFVRDLDRKVDAEWYQPVDQLQSLELSAQSLNMKVHGSAQLTASVLPWTVSDRNVRWSSSNPAVAQVDETGLVTANAAGTCTITATSVLDPSVAASCAVTVETVNLELRGTLRDADGNSKLFTWDLARDDTWTAGASVSITPAAAAYDKSSGSLYLQETKHDYAMHQVDEETGEILASSGMARSGLPTWDLAYCEYFGPGEAVGIYGTYLGSPGSLMKNETVYTGWDFFTYLIYVTGAEKFVAVASAGHQELVVPESQEDGTTIEKTYDAECFYLLDDAGYLWVFGMYETDEGWAGGILDLIPTELAGQLTFLQDGEFQYCSLVEDRETGYLVLSYFTGDTNELYMLYRQTPESTVLTAVPLGNLGDQVWPATIYSVSSTGTQARQTQRLCEGLDTAEMLDVPCTQLTLSDHSVDLAPAGTLQALSEAESRPAAADEKKTISIQIPAPQDSTNGLVHLTYDPALLTLDAVTPYAGLSSVNREPDGQVTLAYAGIPGLSGNSAAEVTFQVREDASGVTKVTCNTLEQGSQIGTQEQPVSTATFTYALSGGQVTGSAGHNCPSLRFRDLKAQWYHEAIDEALNKGLVNGMTEDLFQPEGTLTRAQFVTILHRLASCPGSSQDTPFTDLRSGSFYEEAVRWAYEKGYINGTSQSTFSPNAPLTREMAAAILWRMAGSPASSQALDGFTDAAQIHPYAQTAMAWAVEQAIVVGATATTLAPLSTATRAQGVVLVMRYAER